MSVFRESTVEDRQVWWRDRRVRIVSATIVALLVIFIVWKSCHKTTADESAADVVVSVQVAKAERATIAQEITAVATLAARREATVSPRIAAPIAQMPLLTNRPVHAGDVLVVLESRDLTAQRAEAAAAVTEADAAAHSTANGNVPLTNAQDAKAIRAARANLDNAKKTLDRRQVLFDQGGISKKDLEASQLAFTQAEEDLRLAESSTNLHRGVTNPGDVRVAEAKAQQARNRLQNLDAQLGYSIIRAPFSGVVTQQFQYQGEMANPGGKLLTIADTSALIAKMQLGEETATRLKAGDEVKVLPDDLPGQSFPGIVNLVGRAADPQSRSVEVWVAVANPSGQLRANGVAKVVISAQSVANAITVPDPAVTLDATNATSGTVMVVDNKSVAHEVHVTTGVRSGGKTQILSGLKGGETVVTEGNYGLPDGMKVALPGAEPKAAAGAPPKEE
ncbi:MAG TPA: efflux RND transporter periplasmic adaptor subunit [Thermoanaerobaculia bacterium]